MAGILLSGAYLMRNKKTDTVIEIGDSSHVVTAVENQNARREQQIWWVEALPGPEHETGEGPVYSITNIPRNLNINKMGMELEALKPHGFASQKWWIKRVQDDKDGESYNILSTANSSAIDIKGDNPDAGALCHVSEFCPQSYKQRWEFVCPAVAIPPGWVQIRSVSTDKPLLQQIYFTSPPFLASVTPKSTLSNDRAIWGTQWTFLYGDQGDSTQRYWCIKNRLTGGFLAYWDDSWCKIGQVSNLTAGRRLRGSNVPDMMWRVDTHQDGYWTLLNKSSNSLLLATESSPDAVMQVSLAKKDGPVGNNHKKWEIIEFNKMVCLDVLAKKNTDVQYVFYMSGKLTQSIITLVSRIDRREISRIPRTIKPRPTT